MLHDITMLLFIILIMGFSSVLGIILIKWINKKLFYDEIWRKNWNTVTKNPSTKSKQWYCKSRGKIVINKVPDNLKDNNR